MTKPVVIVGALDTKGEEFRFVRDLLAARKLETVLVDFGVMGDPPFVPDIPAEAVAKAGGYSLAALRAGCETKVPTWSFQTHSRTGYRTAAPATLVVVEGIHALHDEILPHLDLCVYVEAPPDVRWSRWEYLERTGQRGWGVEVAREFFHTVAEPTFEKFLAVYRARAHFVVQNHVGVPRA